MIVARFRPAYTGNHPTQISQSNHNHANTLPQPKPHSRANYAEHTASAHHQNKPKGKSNTPSTSLKIMATTEKNLRTSQRPTPHLPYLPTIRQTKTNATTTNTTPTTTTTSHLRTSLTSSPSAV